MSITRGFYANLWTAPNMTPQQREKHMSDLELLAQACLDRYKEHGMGSELIQANGYQKALEQIKGEK